MYEVDKVKDCRIIKGKKQYLIKWKGYPDNQSTWEPLSHLRNISDLVKDFEKKFQKKKKNKLVEENKENINVNVENKEIISEKKLTGRKRRRFRGRKKIKKKIGRKAVVKKKEEKKIDDVKTDINVKIDKYENKSDNVEKFLLNKDVKKVLTVRKEKNVIEAVIEKEDKEGRIINEIITTNNLKKINPFILLDYYETKIKYY